MYARAHHRLLLGQETPLLQGCFRSEDASLDLVDYLIRDVLHIDRIELLNKSHGTDTDSWDSIGVWH